MKKRHFADGGETDPDLEAANASDDPIAYMNKVKGWTDTEEALAKPKVVTKEELAKSGLSLRDYLNKQRGLTRRSTPYTGAGGSGRGMQGGPTADEMAAYSAPQKAKRLSDMVRMPTTDEIQTGLNTAIALTGAGGLGRMLAKKLMQRGATTAAPAALPAPKPRLSYDKAGAKAAERSARAEGRQAEMLKENARRSGLTEDAPEATRRAVRQNLGGQDWSLPMKKGGSVKKYAKGGSIDGCAQRGKTKGRYL